MQNQIKPICLMAMVVMACASTAVRGAEPAQLSAAEAVAIATEAYIFGYPLITMEMTRRVMTNVAIPTGTRAPMGQFRNARGYPDASFRDVTAPNADTLYSIAWLDLSQEPYLLGLPDAGDRYYLMPMLSGWTDVFQSPGTRTTGNKEQKYAITGPGWQGDLPNGVTQYKSPTNLVWILGRTYCTGTPEDYAAVHALQDKYTLVPLSGYGKPYTPPAGKFDSSIDMQTPVREQVHRLDIASYLKMLAAQMASNPPAADDAPLVEKMAKIGLAAGQVFDIEKLGKETTKALEAVPRAAQQRIMAQFQMAGSLENGWTFSTRTGNYGTDYLQRAFITAIGLGANRPEDAIYPVSRADGAGKAYSGANKYALHFDKDETPPVDAFWSLTMYSSDMFFVANPLNKFTVSPRDALKYNADGSLDIFIQNESPGKDRQANWLPSPKDKFNLMLRMYWPRQKPPSIIDGSWKIPPVKRAG